MKKVIFESLTLEGFRSYQIAQTLPLTGKGLVLIKGSNGNGKTTLFSALCWALFKVNLNGTANDKVQTWEYLRIPEYRGTRVAVTFTVNGLYYLVIRHLNFKGTTKGIKGGNSLMIFERKHDAAFTAADMLGEEQHKGDQQAFINRLLGLEAKAFLNSILFGQRMARLVSADNDDKRKLFEQLFDLDFIATAKEKATLRRNELDVLIATSKTKLETMLVNINNLEETHAEKERLIRDFNNDKTERIADIKAKLQEKNTQLKTAENKLKSLNEDLESLTDISTKINQLEKDTLAAKLEAGNRRILYDTLEKQLKELQSEIITVKAERDKAGRNKERIKIELANVEENCPSCGAPIAADKIETVTSNLRKQLRNENHVIKTMEDRLVTLDNELAVKGKEIDKELTDYKAATEAYNNLLGQHTSYSTKVQQVSDIRAKIGTYKERLTGLTAWIKEYNEMLTETEGMLPPKIDLKKSLQEIGKLKGTVKVLQKELDTYSTERERVNWWITKAFGAGGLKAFVFSAMLEQLNVYIDIYAQRMGFRCLFTVDLTKANKPFITKCFKGDHEIDYSELSGGQKQKLDCAVAFAMHDLINSVTDFNILILDEIFEGLDPAAVDMVFDLIRVKTDSGKLVFVISHSTHIDSQGSKYLNIEMDENQNSYIEV